MHSLKRFSTYVVSLFLFLSSLTPTFALPKSYSTLAAFRQEFVQLVMDVEKCAVSIEAHMGIGAHNGSEPAVEMINSGAGLILDANHIVSKQKIVYGSDQIHITFHDGKSVAGKIIGSDDNLGLSIIRVDDKIDNQLFPLLVSDPAFVAAGEPVLILSNSLGVMPAVSFGIVNCRRNDGMIQLSADLPAGSSGGAVFNFSGELIGLIAVEIDFFPDELPFSSDLLASETVLVNPIHDIQISLTHLISQAGKNDIYFGVAVEDWPSQLGGAHVKHVYKDSPADQAGVKTGDIVLSTDNHKVARAFDLFQIISSHKAGDSVAIQILRGDEMVPVTVTLANSPVTRPQSPKSPNTTNKPPAATEAPSNLNNDYLIRRIKLLENELQIIKEMLGNN